MTKGTMAPQAETDGEKARLLREAKLIKVWVPFEWPDGEWLECPLEKATEFAFNPKAVAHGYVVEGEDKRVWIQVPVPGRLMEFAETSR